MTPEQIKANAPEGATCYVETDYGLFYLKWINRDLYKTVTHDGKYLFFVDTKQYEIKPL